MKRSLRITAVGVVATVAGVASGGPVRAAGVSGSFVTGASMGICQTTVTCNAFRLTGCTTVPPPEAQLDASIRDITALAGNTVSVSWNRTLNKDDASSALNMEFLGVGCTTRGNYLQAAPSSTTVIPAGTRYVVVWAFRPHLQVNWSMNG
jgi:hypothetical protein